MRDALLAQVDTALAAEARGLASKAATAWAAVRSGLAEWQCENCAHWLPMEASSAALCMKPSAYLYQVVTVHHYYCPHFEKKEPTP